MRSDTIDRPYVVADSRSFFFFEYVVLYLLEFLLANLVISQEKYMRCGFKSDRMYVISTTII